MNTKELTDENFSRLISATGRVALVEFGAEWCPPCRAINPVLEELSGLYGGKALISKLNVDTNPTATSDFNVRNLPTFLFFKDGQLVDRIVGAVPKSVLKNRVDFFLNSEKI